MFIIDGMAMLTGKIALVTGGSRGIGEAIVRRLAAEGATVFFTYNAGADRAQSLVQELKASGSSVHAVQADVADADAVANLFKTIAEQSKRLDILVNNAGITKDGLIMRMSEQDWDSVIDTNLKGAFLCCKAAARVMMGQRYGRIINIGSVVGITGNPGQVNYVASKAGVIGLTKSLARELASRNILVNCLAPGYIKTEMTDKLTDAQKTAITDSIPLGRIAEGAEIASVVAFLASDNASYITGQTLAVDGGLAMQS
jgi:3-oxoacyl-[acyl-carrier protein] reductase